VRSAPDKLKAFYNVSRIGAGGWSTRLRVRTALAARGNGLFCGFHGWTFNLEGKNTFRARSAGLEGLAE